MLPYIDPRVYQITFLSLLLFFGNAFRGFEVPLPSIYSVLLITTFGQFIWIQLRKLPLSTFLSSTISGLSILLLCRSNNIEILWFVGILSISSKYWLTFKGKHFANPTNFGILLAVLMGKAWVSPGQWGADFTMAAWCGILGLLVVVRSARFDTAFIFLGTYSVLLAFRVQYLGQSPAILWHQLSSGTLIIFSFFMISDPRSTPDHLMSRWIFATGVALLTFYLRFWHFVPAAPLWALFFMSPLTVILDKIWIHSRFQWRSPYANYTVSHS